MSGFDDYLIDPKVSLLVEYAGVGARMSGLAMFCMTEARAATDEEMSKEFVTCIDKAKGVTSFVWPPTEHSSVLARTNVRPSRAAAVKGGLLGELPPSI